MKMPSNLSRLSNASLVVTAGAFEANLYVMQNGRVVEKENVRKERPTYSDREEFFGRPGGGSGSVYEDARKESTRRSFLEDLGRHIHGMVRGYVIEKVLLFAPHENLAEVKEAVPAELRGKIFHQAPGSFYKRPVTEVLRMVDRAVEDRLAGAKEASAKGEALKILHRGREGGFREWS